MRITRPSVTFLCSARTSCGTRTAVHGVYGLGVASKMTRGTRFSRVAACHYQNANENSQESLEKARLMMLGASRNLP